MTRLLERIWFEESGWPGMVRSASVPAAWLYGMAMAGRNALYDQGLLRTVSAPIPAVSVGNLVVGGTGKTPVAAWMAGELARRGACPAIVMRGYGGDEPLVHAALNPGIPVFVNARREQALRAARNAGRDVAVMDDAFQHRRVGRTEDVVLVSAERFQDSVRLLPAGPGREPISALRRATLVLVTRKAASATDAVMIARRLAGYAGTGAAAVAALLPGSLVDFGNGATRSLDTLRGARVLLASGVGDPRSLATQLQIAGAIVESRVFPDHHVYEPADIDALISEGSRSDILVVTLKDAVKLGPAWPRGAGPLWYVSQRCEIESGWEDLSALLDRLLAARSIQQLAPDTRTGA